MPKKIPLRMCVGCQEMKTKKELVRIVRTPEMAFEVDLTGKKAGRGAYICRGLDCLNKAIKEKRLERAFKQTLSDEIYNILKRNLVSENDSEGI